MTDSFVSQAAIAQNMTSGFEGMIADSSRVNIQSTLIVSRKLVTVALAASDSQTYVVTINGVPFTFIAGVSTTTALIAAGLVAAINGGTQKVLASGTDTPIQIEATGDSAAGDFTAAYSAGTGSLTETVLVAHQSIGFGRGVCMDERSTKNQAVRLPRQASDVTSLRFKGVTVADNYAKVANGGAFKTNVQMPVMRKGHILVRVEEAVTKSDQPYCRYAAGGLGLGAFRKSAGSSEAAAVPSAAFLSNTSANGLAVLEVNLV